MKKLGILLNLNRAVRPLFAICYLLFAVSTGGCAGFKESARGMMGISTKELDKNRKGALKRVFNYEYAACYAKTLQVLKQIGAYIYAEDKKKNMIAIYVSETDTTCVGIYFVPEAHATEVQISSPSAYAKEIIAQKVFSGLEKSLK